MFGHSVNQSPSQRLRMSPLLAQVNGQYGPHNYGRTRTASQSAFGASFTVFASTVRQESKAF